jgi:zinc finger protein
MSADDDRVQVRQGPSEFFGSIGDKVQNLTPAQDATATTNGEDDDEPRAVEEIESLCMSCGKNVSSILF